MNFEQARFNMVEQQIRTWEVLDQAVLDAIAVIPRELFVPEEFQRVAYSDTDIPIGHGEYMMAPKVEARMVQSLDIAPGERGLEIGTGSGYVSAILASLAQEVITLDIYEDFTKTAAERLAARAISNVEFMTRDGLAGLVERGPYDFIAVTGSVGQYPDDYQQQLTLGGRLFIVVGRQPIMEARLVTRVSETAFTSEVLFETDLKPLVGAEMPATFSF